MASLSTRSNWRARPDLSLLLIVSILSLIGFLMILSASAPTAQVQLKDSLFFFRRQLLWGVLSVAALLIGTVMPLERLRAMTKPLMIGTGALLIATHIPGLGTTVYGSSRWLKLGPLSIQPSELAKIVLILFVADFLARHKEHGWKLQELRQVLLPIGGMLGLVLFQPDLGTTLMLGLACFVLFFCNGTSVWKMGAWAATGIVGVLFVSLTTPYQKLRWMALRNPWDYPRDIGFQLIQSLYAIGSGGFFGEGWGQGKQKLFYLPIQHADFIFAVLAEELGLLGSLATIGLFLLLAQRGFAIAHRAQQPFHQLLVIGLTTLTVAQAFTNIGVVTASLPTTGIPLPFLSAGGTSLMVTLFAVGLILNVSRQHRVELRLLKQEQKWRA